MDVIDPLENAWVVNYPSTTVPNGKGVVNTSTTGVYKYMTWKTEANWYCDCGKCAEPDWKYCPYCGKELWVLNNER